MSHFLRSSCLRSGSYRVLSALFLTISSFHSSYFQKRSLSPPATFYCCARLHGHCLRYVASLAQKPHLCFACHTTPLHCVSIALSRFTVTPDNGTRSHVCSYFAPVTLKASKNCILKRILILLFNQGYFFYNFFS